MFPSPAMERTDPRVIKLIDRLVFNRNLPNSRVLLFSHWSFLCIRAFLEKSPAEMEEHSTADSSVATAETLPTKIYSYGRESKDRGETDSSS